MGERIIVIGTGPAGAAAAWALHDAGASVTVLEAGSEASAKGFVVRAPGATLLRSRRPLPHATAKDLTESSKATWSFELSAGGLSNHWTSAVPRFSPEDFTADAVAGEEYRWPIGYADLVPHYRQMEKVLHISGGGTDVAQLPGGEVSRRVSLKADWAPLQRAAGEQGRGIAPLPLCYAEEWTVSRSGNTFNSYVRMVEPLKKSPRMQVLFGAEVLRLEWSAQEKRVTRAIYRDSSGREQAIEGRAFVMAAGAIHSPRLLLQSKSEAFPQGLGNREDVLGRYLHDHPIAKMALKIGKPVSIHPPVFLTRDPYGKPFAGIATILWSGTSARAKSLLQRTPDKASHIGFNLFGSLRPSRENCVRLAADGRVEIALEFGPEVTALLEHGRDSVVRIFRDAGIAAEVDGWWVDVPGTSVHYGGAVRMHESPKLGMLDGWNRLHSAPNVLVVDASSFTTGPEKNPTLTAMAIAARAASRLALETAGLQ